MYVLLFFACSFLGWCMEVACKLVQFGRFINRGFLLGPLCPIYGTGAVRMAYFLPLWTTQVESTFLLALVLCGTLEYITSWLMEKLFQARWWDYSQKRFNINGRVCASNLLAFGVMGVFVVKMTVIQNRKSSWGVNDQSAMLMVQYGDRRMLLAGDNENRSQQYFAANPPEIGLNADIFKYPHHGQVRLRDDFLEAINPQLIFINGAANVIKGSVNYCDKKHISYLLGYKGLTRMRTDGNIWVIDYLKEKNADRDLPYTPERDE